MKTHARTLIFIYNYNRGPYINTEISNRGMIPYSFLKFQKEVNNPVPDKYASAKVAFFNQSKLHVLKNANTCMP